MSNFQFLQTEFKPLYPQSKAAEQLVYSDPRACCMRARHALEQAVHWLYGNPPIFRRRQKWNENQAAAAIFITGVMPTMAVLGRWLLYVQSQRGAASWTSLIVSKRSW